MKEFQRIEMGLTLAYFTAITFYFASIIAQSFGELVVLRHPPTPDGVARNLTCISEDDDAALIWNHNSIDENELNSGKSIFRDFRPKRPTPNDGVNCAVWESVWGRTSCIANWESRRGWDVVNSTNRPMGPVLDYRWEGFEEFVFKKSIQEEDYQYVGRMNGYSDTAVFSARGSNDIYVFLCEKKQAVEGRCLWILLGGWKNTKSGIRSCAKKAPLPSKATTDGDPCGDLAKHELKNIINEYEWRTFVIKWIKERKTIQVYKDGKDEPFLQGYLDNWHNISHISVRSLVGTRIRFHFYKYFESKTEGAKISTVEFLHNGRNFCAELLVGLCPECRLNVNLVNNGGRSIKTWNISGDGKSVYNGMLTWRSERLNATSLNFGSNPVRLEIESILNEDDDQGRWAIGNLRICQSDGVLRESTVTIHGQSSNGIAVWPRVNCQKLSYSKSAVVDSISTKTIGHYTKELERFSRGRQRSYDGPLSWTLGEKWSLCSPTGCTCDRGYQGNDCGVACLFGSYGYKCNEKCGSCNPKSCNKVNGHCNECSNQNLMLPLCKKELEKPIIVNVTDYTVKLLQNVEIEVHEWITHIEIKIQHLQGVITSITPLILTRSGNLSTYRADIANLTRDATYTVYTRVRMKVGDRGITTHSSKNYFTTTCLGKPLFELAPEETEITLTRLSRAKECKDPSYEKYWLQFRNPTSSRTFPQSFAVPILPQRLVSLTPYTEYELAVFTTNNPPTTLWITKISTLQSVPGKVSNLATKYVSDTEVTLQWTAAPVNGGVITGYRVSIQKKAMIGCKILRKGSPQKIVQDVTATTVSVSGLHPYARYTVNVMARTTKDGLPSWLEFETDPKYIPTSAFQNLQLKENNRRLEWEEPKDCTTISGNTSAAVIFITGVSDWAKSWTHREETSKSYFDIESVKLMPYTVYKVEVHVIRELNKPENLTCYQKREWRTESAAPLAVTSLKVYDANLEDRKISLRWKPPYPPSGEIESYHVRIDEGNSPPKTWPKEISESKSRCQIWKNFICLENLTLNSNLRTNIKVYSKNKGVERNGAPENLTVTPAVYTKVPRRPRILKEAFPDPGVVLFKWDHPFSPTYITEFKISVKYENTSLLKIPNTNFPSPFSYPVKKKHKMYSMKLRLAPSTRYKISIVSTNRRNSSIEESKIIQVPNGFGFVDGGKLVARKNGTLINLKVPGIANATRKALVQIVVDKNFETFQPSTSLPRVINNTQLVIAKYDVNISTSKNLVIDANQTDLQNTSCSLVLGKTCILKVIVVDEETRTANEIGIVEIKLNDDHLLLTCSYTVPILALCLILFCVYCRRRCTRISRRRKDAHAYPTSSTSVDNLISLFTWKSSTSPRNRVEDRNSTIYAVPYEADSRIVRVEYFPEYAKIAATSGLLLSQYMMFPRDLTKPCKYGRLPQNIEKNRDKNLIAYDETRVTLNKLPGEPHSDYINANYIQGHRGEKAYIATQGPMPNTVEDFWRMVWQEKVYVICMLTNIVENGQMNCEQYWPNDGSKLKYGEVSVLIIDHQVFADYTVRIIKLSCQKYKRKITHLHYTVWPSNGIPTYPQSLVAYLKRMEETPTGNGPIVVHCNTGTGRTGTLILCDICLHQAAEEKVIDILAVTTQMRSSRANMVGSSQQYILAHVVIMESITTSQTGVPCTEDLAKLIEKLRQQLPKDVDRLNNRVWQERVLYSLVPRKCPTPGDFTRIKLPVLDSVCPEVIYFERCSGLTNESSNYIGAVSVDGVKTKKQYLASQLPSTSTWSKFWLIIAQKDIELIIILQNSDPRDPSCCNIVPNKSSFTPVPHILVKRKEELCEEDHFTTERLLLTNTSKDGTTPQPVTVLTCTGWEKGKNGRPPIPEALVSLWLASGKILRRESRTLVLCHDGITGCGLYLALSFLLERMAVERECDVISAVRAVRRFRPEFVGPIDQFEYLYDAAVDYAKRFEIYRNFS